MPALKTGLPTEKLLIESPFIICLVSEFRLKYSYLPPDEILSFPIFLSI